METFEQTNKVKQTLLKRANSKHKQTTNPIEIKFVVPNKHKRTDALKKNKQTNIFAQSYDFQTTLKKILYKRTVCQTEKCLEKVSQYKCTDKHLAANSLANNFKQTENT